MNNSVSAYKSLSPNEYRITPFRAYASHDYTYVSGSANNSVDVQILFAKQYISQDEVRTENVEQELFDSITRSFYSEIPYTSYGIVSSSYYPSASTFVVSVTQDLFGEEITPRSFSVKIGTSMSYDDGKGNLIISSSGVGSIVGSIFYDKGIALLKPTSGIIGGGLTSDGICIVEGTNVQVQFSSSVKLFEHNIRIKLNPTDFLYSVHNPSANKNISSINKTAIQLMASQSLYPYVTTIGLYNDTNELLATAKVSNPIQRTDYSVQTFVVKFDT